IAVPQGSAPPEIAPLTQAPPIDLVEPDVFISGEVRLLAAPPSAKETKAVLIWRISSIAFHVVVIGIILLLPKLFPPHMPTQEELELARNNTTLLLPSDVLDITKPELPPRPVMKSNPVHVDPREIRKIAPTVVPPPTPVPEPKENLPTAP